MRINPEKVEKMILNFLRTELSRIGYKKGIVGLSGGLDSTTVLFLLVRAVGPENAIAVIMPHEVSSRDSVEDALEVVSVLGVKHYQIDITPMVEAYFEKMPTEDKVLRGNKMARERMSILYDLSARERALVIGTSNKSELLLGYGTLFGDLASAINPIGDLYKTQIRQLAEYLGVPEKIRKKPPSADLWVGQTDEGELGITYDEADKILYALIDERRPREEVEKKYGREKVDGILRKVYAYHFKRLPPQILKISSRTVGRDFLYSRDVLT